MIDTQSYVLKDPQSVGSPAILVYPEIIRENMSQAIAVAGDAERLRPHVKTHKCAEIARIQMDHGITRFKCATLVEAAMLAAAGAPDVLIAYPMIGPNIERLISVCRRFPETDFKVLIDSEAPTRALANACSSADMTVEVVLDLDTGMHRTGVPPGEEATSLYRLAEESGGITPGGLHCYDGHCHQPDLEERCAASRESRVATRLFAQHLRSEGLPVPRIVLGGTPTFPCHAADGDEELSPGTFVLHDGNYLRDFADLPFRPAALLLTRVISRPSSDRITLDLGHKAVSADPAGLRAFVVATATLGDVRSEDFEPVSQSEEHWVLRTPHAQELSPGEPVYVLPAHICPTVALYERMHVVKEGVATDSWPIVARRRDLD